MFYLFFKKQQWYVFVLGFCLLFFSSCSVCKFRISRSMIEVNKDQLACNCGSIKRDSALVNAISVADKRKVMYAAGKVLVNKQGKGVYQYFTNGVGARQNQFTYYNGKRAYVMTVENMDSFIDSLVFLRISHRDINDKMIDIKNKLRMPPAGSSDSF